MRTSRFASILAAAFIGPAAGSLSDGPQAITDPAPVGEQSSGVVAAVIEDTVVDCVLAEHSTERSAR